jgi:hypothetical protein
MQGWNTSLLLPLVLLQISIDIRLLIKVLLSCGVYLGAVD